MMHFRLRDYLSVLAYRVLGRRLFETFSRGVRIVLPVRIVGSRYIRLEDSVTLQYGAYVAVLPAVGATASLRFGSGTMVGSFAHIVCTRAVNIGERVLIADRVFISDTEHDYRDPTRPVMDQPLRYIADVSIGPGSWIGENVCILGCKIGRNCVIGANSVVTKDVPDFCVAAGAPAALIRRYCEQTGRWRRTSPDGVFVE